MPTKLCARIMADALPFSEAASNGGPDLRAGIPSDGKCTVSMAYPGGRPVELDFDVGDLEQWCMDVRDAIHRAAAGKPMAVWENPDEGDAA